MHCWGLGLHLLQIELYDGLSLIYHHSPHLKKVTLFFGKIYKPFRLENVSNLTRE